MVAREDGGLHSRRPGIRGGGGVLERVAGWLLRVFDSKDELALIAGLDDDGQDVVLKLLPLLSADAKEAVAALLTGVLRAEAVGHHQASRLLPVLRDGHVTGRRGRIAGVLDPDVVEDLVAGGIALDSVDRSLADRGRGGEGISSDLVGVDDLVLQGVQEVGALGVEVANELVVIARVLDAQQVRRFVEVHEARAVLVLRAAPCVEDAVHLLRDGVGFLG